MHSVVCVPEYLTAIVPVIRVHVLSSSSTAIIVHRTTHPTLPHSLQYTMSTPIDDLFLLSPVAGETIATNASNASTGSTAPTSIELNDIGTNLLPQQDDFDFNQFLAIDENDPSGIPAADFPVDTALPFEGGESWVGDSEQQPTASPNADNDHAAPETCPDQPISSNDTGLNYGDSLQTNSNPAVEDSSTYIDPRLFLETATNGAATLLPENTISANIIDPQLSQELDNIDDEPRTHTALGLYDEQNLDASQVDLLFQGLDDDWPAADASQTTTQPLNLLEPVFFEDGYPMFDPTIDWGNEIVAAYDGLVQNNDLPQNNGPLLNNTYGNASNRFSTQSQQLFEATFADYDLDFNGTNSDTTAQMALIPSTPFKNTDLVPVEGDYLTEPISLDAWCDNKYGIDRYNSFAPYYNEAPKYPPLQTNSCGLETDSMLDLLQYKYPAPPTANIAPPPPTALTAGRRQSRVSRAKAITSTLPSPAPKRALGDDQQQQGSAKRQCLLPASALSYCGPQVSSDRRSKKMMAPNTNPDLFYTTPLPKVPNWGPVMQDGQPLFSYLPSGRLLDCRTYNAQQIQHYIDSCPQSLRLWLQQAPSQSNNRLVDADSKCRYAHCPSKNRKILPGWLRVAFDEFPEDTSSGARDPYKVAMAMHLWCFEQCCDPHELFVSGVLLPENRSFPLEQKNPMAVTKNSDRMIIGEAFMPWQENQKVQREAWGKRLVVPRVYQESLSYAMVKHHLDHQISSRQTTREARNSTRPASSRNTIDIHMGDLAVFAERAEMAVRMPRKGEKTGKSTSGSNEESVGNSMASSSDEGTNTTVNSQPRTKFFNPLASK